MLPSVIDAREDQDVATVDIPNELVQMDLPIDDPKEK